MKILEKRPLALILSIMLGGFSFFADLGWQIKVVLASVALLCIGVIYVFEDLKRGRNVLTITSLVSLALSLFLSCAWENSFYPDEHYDTNASISAKVYDIDNSGSSTSISESRLSSISVS